ncbi:WD40-repeat containing protein [Gracilaria domingensis]|nr:WD40-repeat containing protein [Gracilaria domingensis]
MSARGGCRRRGRRPVVRAARAQMGGGSRARAPKLTPLSDVKPTARKRVARANRAAQRAYDVRREVNDAAVLQTDAPGLLQPQSELEHTYHFTQSALDGNVDMATMSKARFEMHLAGSRLTPYHTACYSRSSRSLLLASRLGHVALMDWRSFKLHTELMLNETVRSATFLHNDSFFATAQKQFAYVYDANGLQLHVLRNHRDPDNLVFLPHHLLLASTSSRAAVHGRLVYTDTSTGQVLNEHDYAARHLRLNAATDACANFSNGVVHLAHTSGVVSLWSPITGRPLARMLTHHSAVNHVAVEPSGRYMFTTGDDSVLACWDLRTYRKLFQCRTPKAATSLCVSQRQLVAFSFGASVQVWAPFSNRGDLSTLEKRTQPYMKQTYPGSVITGLNFCPFEDVLAVCHESGVRNMIVPGAGEPTFDTNAPNPYETRKQRTQNEVRTLIDKLPPASIVLDPSTIGAIDQDPHERLREIREQQRYANLEKIRKKSTKKKQKGRNKISKRVKRAQENAMQSRALQGVQEREERRKTKEQAERIREKDFKDAKAGIRPGGVGSTAPLPDALQRFVRKK